MILKEKLLPLSYHDIGKREIDWLALEWHETNKRILHKKTAAGRDITLKFLQENQNLTQDDVLYEDAETIIAVEIAACEAISIRPRNSYEMATICYEIGNKHLPLFLANDELMVALDIPLLRLLKSAGYEIAEGMRKLISPLKTSVAPHGSSILFSKIRILPNDEK
ncbi:MAG: urease accessory protein UreE [Chitinophagaceae bacterium]